MATTVTWEALRELAAFRAEKGCAISVYLDLDPSVTTNAGDLQTRVRSLVDTGARSGAATDPTLTHDQREALRGDFERIRRYFEQDFSRDGVRGFALFCSGLDNFWRALPLGEAVPDEVKANRDFYLAPLVPLVGRGEGALVAVVGRERGELLCLRGGRLEQLAEHTDEQPRRHHQGGWSQARYQRRIDNMAQEHMRRVAEELDRRVRRLRSPKVVVVSTEDTRAEFNELLSNEARNAVVGWTTAEAHAGPPELLACAAPVLERWQAEQERQAIDRWREEAGRNGRAAAGWRQVVEAASDGRVEVLLYVDGVAKPAWTCPACGRLAPEAGKCPLDGTGMERREEGLDVTVHKTLSHGGTVLAVRHHQDLDPVEGIGALLRY